MIIRYKIFKIVEAKIFSLDYRRTCHRLLCFVSYVRFLFFPFNEKNCIPPTRKKSHRKGKTCGIFLVVLVDVEVVCINVEFELIKDTTSPRSENTTWP